MRDKAAFRRGVRRLEHLGYVVEVDEGALSSDTRFAGDDAQRVQSIVRAAASGADVALISRGGYGLTRILEHLPYAAIERAIASGTHFVGMSDFTAFQAAVFARTGAVTWAGPALCEGFGPGGPDGGAPDDIMEDCFADLVLGQGEGAGWRQDKNFAALPESEWLLCDATVWGGNLCVLTSLLGTPYFPQIDRGILFIEDVAEHPYRIERMLTQLLHSGVLARQGAVVLGQFTQYKLTPHDRGFNMRTVVQWLRSQLAIPVLTNLPYGHVPTKVVLPFGKKSDLAVTGKDVMLFWGH